MNENNLKELLDYIDPAACSYQEWVNVGMALKHEGYFASDWDAWSARDSARYKPGDCWTKWESFKEESMGLVTGGTIFHMAVEGGYVPPEKNRALDWNDDISADAIIDTTWVQPKGIHEPKRWDPVHEIIEYLSILFDSDEYVGYVTESHKSEKGKYIPKGKGTYSRTAGEIIADLEKYKSIEEALGTVDADAGAWIRFNPLDGKGIRDTNVTSYRYALVECDEVDIEQQNALIRELELPVATLTYSGKKSLHAIVRIDAANYTEYKKRVDELFSICRQNGLNIDTQNKNPSRLSRMPGVRRGEKKQFLIDTNIGKGSWAEWRQWYDEQLDDLPDTISLDEVWNDMPELAPEQISGVLRKGHKMLIAGPSKAGKTFLEIELAIATAEGLKWCGFQCTQGKVLFINLEVDTASFLERLRDVYEGMNIEPKNLSNIKIMNLRGYSRPLDKLVNVISRRANKVGADMIIVDPIYKVITGDENSAEQMAKFCNQFDRICNETGASIVYCHHHSKGNQQQKKAMDRASGSGVFARDPDAVVDLIDVKVPMDVFINDPECTGWKLDFTLREFKKPAPVYLWFKHPVHWVDDEHALMDVEKEEKKKPSKMEKNISDLESWVMSQEEPPTVADATRHFGKPRSTINRWFEASENLEKDDEKRLIYILD